MKLCVLRWIFSNCACADCWLASKARRAGNGLASSRSPVTSIDARCPLPVHLLPPLLPSSKRNVDSTSPNQRPVRRLSGLLSRGRSNLATPQAKLTRSPIRVRSPLSSSPPPTHMHAYVHTHAYTHSHTQIFSRSFFFSLILSLILLHLFSSLLAPSFILPFSRSLRRRQGEQPRTVSALLSPASLGTLIE